ncbi:hypothetical protein [Methylobrevis pamukkalensis]|uniref:Uncharacterized protein n=1 Tax=Methylobrevis pamukkalensis TaxID=1439726 RepID=A0A1E3H7D6_9HYPH|nr:hypothetical protein [Methylobrevis pamukkalensis]ODN71686.1 hypothetical protein A6302_00930 [Methylobrevis pamukkalensis]
MRSSNMPLFTGVLLVLVLAVGVLGYLLYEENDNALEIGVGDQGVTIDAD